ncbi:MAG: ROK family protein [Alphaproteobacteria bacterium]|nr:ROK family protein [Alphaproteobacteria bacterium]
MRRALRAPAKTTPVEMLRVRHRMQALVCLRDCGPMSRVELCRRLGQSTTTMTKVVADLMSLGWVGEGKSRPTNEPGRPATALHIREVAPAVLVAVVEPRRITTARVGLDLSPGERRSARLDIVGRTGADAVAAIAAHLAREAHRLAATGRPVAAAAIVAPGTTDAQLRTSRYALFFGWRNLDVAGPVEAALGLPALLVNNTRAMGLAEFRHLGLPPGESLLFVQARHGVGAALIDIGSAELGAPSAFSELGHMPVGRNRLVEGMPAHTAVVDVLRESYLRGVLGAGEETASPVRAMEERASRGDRRAAALRAQTVENLAAALGAAVNLLMPARIAIGGMYAEGSDAFLADVHSQMPFHAQAELLENVELARTALGPDGAIAGGAIVAFDRLLRQASAYRRRMGTR